MSKKTKSTSGPSKWAKPMVQQGVNAVTDSYQQNKPRLDGLMGQLDGFLPQIGQNTMNNQNLAAANDYNMGVLGGDYLDGNPYLEAMIGRTSNDVQNRVNGAIGTRGRTGGDAHSQIMTRELADSQNALRYQNYATERGFQNQAVGQAAGLNNAYNQNVATLLAAYQGAADLPWSNTNNYARGLAGLLGNATTTTQSPGLGASLMQAIGSASQAAGAYFGGKG